MEKILQPNDIFVATMSNPQATVMDFLQNDINVDNTSFLTKDEYKNTPLVKKLFTKDGVFDENAFNKAYDLAEYNYFKLDDKKIETNLEDYLSYGMTSRYKPINGKTRDVSSVNMHIKNNPLQQAFSLTGLNLKSDPVLTPEEAAQSGGIWDPVNKKWLEGTAETRSGISKAFGETLVYAQYDQDGWLANPVTGEIGEHRKGEFITDADGNYFTEILGDRLLGDKKVVSMWDTITEEGSLLNKYDFMDSDGYDKNIGGIAAKTVMQIAPYFIPGFQQLYGGFTAVMGLASVMPVFAKSIDSLIYGEENTNFSRSATKLENWFKKYNTGISLYGSLHFFSLESIGNLVADLSGQLWQLRAAASLSKAFIDIPKLPKNYTPQLYLEYLKAAEKMNKASKALSLGYMGLVQSADVYQEALNSGYDKRTAGLAALMSAAASFGIMNYNEGPHGFGTWFLDKTTGYNHEITRAPAMKAAKTLVKELDGKVKEALNTGNKKGIGAKLSLWKFKMLNTLDDAWRGEVGEDIWKGFIVEGIEEVTEEMIQDSVKGMIDTLSWLGYTAKDGSFGGWSNVFSKEGAERYFLTAVAGAFGGALFGVQRNVSDWLNKKWDPSYVTERDLRGTRDIYDLIYTGRTEELIDEIKKCKRIFSDKRAGTAFIDSEGKKHDIKAINSEDTLADLVIKSAILYVKALETFKNNALMNLSVKVDDNESLGLAMSKYFKTENKKVHEYLKEKFIDTLAKTKASFDLWQGSSETVKQSEDKEKEEKKTSEEVLTEEVKKADKEAKSEEKEKVLTKDSAYNAFLKLLKELRGFFSGLGWIDNFKEAQLVLKTLVGKHISEIPNIETFYNLAFEDDLGIKWADLEDQSSDPNKMTKAKVSELYKVYKEAYVEKDAKKLVLQMPVLRKSLEAMQKKISKQVVKWIDSEHKEAIIKDLKVSRISDELLDLLIDNFDDSELFDEAVFDELSKDPARLEEEKKKAKTIAHKIIKGNDLSEEENLSSKITFGEKLKGLISNFKSKNLVNLLQLHPHAWTLADKYYFNIGKKLIDSGVIELTDDIKSNSKIRSIIEAIIDKNIYTHSLTDINLEVIKNLPSWIHTAMDDDNDVFGIQLHSLFAEEGIDINKDFIDVNPLKYNKDITKVKLNSLIDYIGTDSYISEDVFNAISMHYKSKMYLILNLLKPINSNIANSIETSSKSNISEDTDRVFKEGKSIDNLLAEIDLLAWIDLDFITGVDSNPILASGIVKVLDRFDAIFQELGIEPPIIEEDRDFRKAGTIDPDTREIILNYSENDAYNNVLAYVLALQNYMKELAREYKSFEDTYRSNLVENPFYKLASTIYREINGTNVGENVLKWAFNKAKALRDGNFSAENISLTESDKKNIVNAKDTLGILSTAVHTMIAYDPTLDGQYGFSLLTIDYAKSLGLDPNIREDLTMISKEDGQYIEESIAKAIRVLDDLQLVNSELSIDKGAYFNKANKKILKGLATFFAFHMPKYRLSIPPTDPTDEPEDLGALMDDLSFNENDEALYLGFIINAKQNIALHILDLKTDARVIDYAARKHSGNVNLAIVSLLILMMKEGLDHLRPELLNTSSPLEDLFAGVTKTDKHDADLYILPFLVGLINADLDPKTRIQKILDIYDNNPKLFVRQDLLNAAEHMLATFANREEFAYLLAVLATEYDHYFQALPVNDPNRLILRIQVPYLTCLLGEGGSGKTLLASILAMSEANEFSEVVALAKNKKKSDLLKDAIKVENPDKVKSLDFKELDKASHFKKFSELFEASRKEALNTLCKETKRLGTKDASDLSKYTAVTSPLLDYVYDAANDIVTVKIKDGTGTGYVMEYTITRRRKEGAWSSSFNKINLTKLPTIADFNVNNDVLIIVDEVTLLNLFEIQFLNELARSCSGTGMQIIVLGDNGQASDKVDIINHEGNAQTIVYNTPNYLFNYLSPLKGAWRASTSCTKENSEAFYAIRRLSAANRKNDKLNDADLQGNAALKTINENLLNFVFKYNLKDPKYGFIGTKFSKSDDDTKNIINLIKKAPEPKLSGEPKLGIIVESEADKSAAKTYFESLVDFNYEIVTIDEVQGAEYDYTILYKLKEDASKSSSIAKAYTAITRGRYGNLIVSTNSGDLFLGDQLKLKNSDGTGKDFLDETGKVLEEAEVWTATLEFVNEMKAILSRIPDIVKHALPTPSALPVPPASSTGGSSGGSSSTGGGSGAGGAAPTSPSASTSVGGPVGGPSPSGGGAPSGPGFTPPPPLSAAHSGGGASTSPAVSGGASTGGGASPAVHSASGGPVTAVTGGTATTGVGIGSTTSGAAANLGPKGSPVTAVGGGSATSFPHAALEAATGSVAELKEDTTVADEDNKNNIQQIELYSESTEGIDPRTNKNKKFYLLNPNLRSTIEKFIRESGEESNPDFIIDQEWAYHPGISYLQIKDLLDSKQNILLILQNGTINPAFANTELGYILRAYIAAAKNEPITLDESIQLGNDFKLSLNKVVLRGNSTQTFKHFLDYPTTDNRIYLNFYEAAVDILRDWITNNAVDIQDLGLVIKLRDGSDAFLDKGNDSKGLNSETKESLDTISLLLIGLKFNGEEDTSYITFGTPGLTRYVEADDDTKSIRYTSATLQTAYKDFYAHGLIPIQKHYLYNENPHRLFKEMRLRRNYIENPRLDPNWIVLHTGLRELYFKSEYKAANQEVFTESTTVLEKHLKILLYEYLKRGCYIADSWKNSSKDTQTAQLKFEEWFKKNFSFAAAELGQGFLDFVQNHYNRLWIGLKKPGSNTLIPLMINQVAPSLKAHIIEQWDKTVKPSSYKNPISKEMTLNWYYMNLIMKYLLARINKNKDKNSLLEFPTLTHDMFINLKNPEKDLASIIEFKNKLLNASELNDFDQTTIEDFINTYTILSISSWIFHKIQKQKNEILNGYKSLINPFLLTYFKGTYYTPQNAITKKSLNDSTSLISRLLNHIDKIDPGYFFITDETIQVSDYNTDDIAKKTVVSLWFESPNKVICFNGLKEKETEGAKATKIDDSGNPSGNNASTVGGEGGSTLLKTVDEINAKIEEWNKANGNVLTKNNLEGLWDYVVNGEEDWINLNGSSTENKCLLDKLLNVAKFVLYLNDVCASEELTNTTEWDILKGIMYSLKDHKDLATYISQELMAELEEIKKLC